MPKALKFCQNRPFLTRVKFWQGSVKCVSEFLNLSLVCSLDIMCSEI